MSPWPRPGRDLWLPLVLFAVAFGAWAYIAEPLVTTPDAHDYAQIAREIHRGHGQSTQQIFPRHVAWLDNHDRVEDDHWPNLHRYPATPAVIAGVMTVVDDPSRAAILQSGVFYALSVALAWLLARRFLPSAPALACALLVAADPHALRAAASGMTEPLAISLTLGALLAATSTPLERRHDAWRWLGFGALLGLGYLTRTQLLALVPIGIAAALFATGERDRPTTRQRALLLMLIGAVVVITPWLVRNAALTGDPSFSFSTSRNLARDVIGQDLDLDLDAPVSSTAIARQHAGAIAGKWFTNMAAVVSAPFWRVQIGPWLEPFLWLLAVAGVRRAIGRLRGQLPADRLLPMVLALALATLAISSLAFHRPRFFDPLRAPILIAASLEAWYWLARWPRLSRSRLALATLIAVAVGTFVVNSRDIESKVQAVADGQRQHAEISARLSDLLPTDSIVISDVSFRIALLADRRSVRLPSDPQQLELLMSKLPRRRYLYVAERALEGFAGYRPGAYNMLFETPKFAASYELIARLADGSLLFRRLD